MRRWLGVFLGERLQRLDRGVIFARVPQLIAFVIGELGRVGVRRRGEGRGHCLGPGGLHLRPRRRGRSFRLTLLFRRRGLVNCRRRLQRAQAAVLVGAEPGQLRLHHRDAIPILFGLAEDVRHLPLQRVQPAVEVADRLLGRRGSVAEARRVGGLALGEDLPLDLSNLLLEPLDPLLRCRRAALGGSGRQGEYGEGGYR